jgi:hypothetical protein
VSIKSMHTIALISLGVFVTSVAVADETRPRRKDTRLPQPKQARLTTYVIPKVLRPGQTLTFNIKVSLDPGWRIFPHSPVQPAVGGPVLTRFDFFDTGGFVVVSDWHASMPTTAKPDPAFPNQQTIEFFEEEITWSIRLKVPQGIAEGDKTLRCQANYMLMSAQVITIPGRWTLDDVRVTIRR